MKTFLELGELWGIIYKGMIGALISLVNMTIPEWVVQLFGVSDVDDLTGVGKIIYDIIFEVLDAIPMIGTDGTFASLSLMSIMLGAGIVLVIVISIARWLMGILP